MFVVNTESKKIEVPPLGNVTVTETTRRVRESGYVVISTGPETVRDRFSVCENPTFHTTCSTNRGQQVSQPKSDAYTPRVFFWVCPSVRPSARVTSVWLDYVNASSGPLLGVELGVFAHAESIPHVFFRL